MTLYFGQVKDEIEYLAWWHVSILPQFPFQVLSQDFAGVNINFQLPGCDKIQFKLTFTSAFIIFTFIQLTFTCSLHSHFKFTFSAQPLIIDVDAHSIDLVNCRGKFGNKW